MIKAGEDEFAAELPIYLFTGTKCKLVLNNDTSDYYYDLISKGYTNINSNSIHQSRLIDAYKFLKKHIENQISIRDKTEYLRDLFDAIIRKLCFSYYPIEVESEIGMTFELMNSRGKELSSLELLKNYLMYWVYRNIQIANEKEDLTNQINKAWKEVFINLSNSNGNENQCLRIAWTIFYTHIPKNWKGYEGFKSDHVVPLRIFSHRSKIETRNFISSFVNELAVVSIHYSAIIFPLENSLIKEEYTLLTKINNIGNISSFLPLLVVARRKVINDKISKDSYIRLLKTLELFSYRVFLWAEKRSNTGLSKFYRWSNELYNDIHTIDDIIGWILGSIEWYSNENEFRNELCNEFHEWYYHHRLIKYTLFEYELFLLKVEGKGLKPKLLWNELSESTLEHILPQNPDRKSDWSNKWSKGDIKKYLHDISNIVLTLNNSHYSNFDYQRKKGSVGVGFCYANSDIRQERQIASYDEWTVKECKNRRQKLIDWIIARWGINEHYEINEEILKDEDDDFEE